MKNSMLSQTRHSLGCVIAALAVGVAGAQPYPAKPVRVIVPYPAGGGMDVVTRALANEMNPRLGQSLIIDNRPGAGATIGAEAAARSAPDGYTIFMGSVVDYSIAPFFYPNARFDIRRDFAPVGDIGYGTIALVVTPSLPVKSVKELVALAKANPGQITYASSGTGGAIHLTNEMFRQMAGINIVHVPYKGTALFLPDLMAGRILMSLDNVLGHVPHIKTGRVRALAVATRTRSAILPELPTMIEAGMPNFESGTRYTLFAPTGTPQDAIARLNREANAVLQQGDLREKLTPLGITLTGGSPEAVVKLIATEMAKWAKVIKDGNIKPE